MTIFRSFWIKKPITKRVLDKSNVSKVVSEFAILLQKEAKIAQQKKIIYFLFFGEGQDQQQHPAVHSGELARGGSVAVAVGVSDM